MDEIESDAGSYELAVIYVRYCDHQVDENKQKMCPGLNGAEVCQKIMQIVSGILKTWIVKRSGPLCFFNFSEPLCLQ